MAYRPDPPFGQFGHVGAASPSTAEAPGACNLVYHVDSVSVCNPDHFGRAGTETRFLAIFFQK
jgi:hypothetical protein